MVVISGDDDSYSLWWQWARAVSSGGGNRVMRMGVSGGDWS